MVGSSPRLGIGLFSKHWMFLFTVLLALTASVSSGQSKIKVAGTTPPKSFSPTAAVTGKAVEASSTKPTVAGTMPPKAFSPTAAVKGKPVEAISAKTTVAGTMPPKAFSPTAAVKGKPVEAISAKTTAAGTMPPKAFSPTAAVTGKAVEASSTEMTFQPTVPFDYTKEEPACSEDDEIAKDVWDIYCSGRILQSVNYHKIFPDSKTFVDMPMKFTANETNKKFDAKFNESTPIQDINKQELEKFIKDNFEQEGHELRSCTPVDWKEKPDKILAIKNETLRNWALHLHGIWKDLCKEASMKPEVRDMQSRNSLIYVDQPFIVPGGRFREFYYWDAYWIVKGLLVSEMYTSVRNMLENLGSMIKRIGFIPNGGRVYYLKRSQPPLFCGMVYEYYKETKNMTFVQQMLPLMEKEQAFWNEERTVTVTTPEGQNYTVYQYRANSNVPRPESYKEDVNTAKEAAAVKDEDRRRFHQNIASAAESGWDFSTRWFRDHKQLKTIETLNILPADLNAFQCWNIDIIRRLYKKAGNEAKAKEYEEKLKTFHKAMEAVFYNNTEGSWFDMNMRTKSHNTHYYLSNAAPLFTRCFSTTGDDKALRVYAKMKAEGAFDHPYGIPTSSENSGQQWDFPNAWPNLNHLAIEALRNSGSADMEEQAFVLAEKWLQGNYRVYSKNETMWEKYHVDDGREGGGGEYNPQVGFGWTNGAVLDLLHNFNERLYNDQHQKEEEKEDKKEEETEDKKEEETEDENNEEKEDEKEEEKEEEKVDEKKDEETEKKEDEMEEDNAYEKEGRKERRTKRNSGSSLSSLGSCLSMASLLVLSSKF